MDSPFLFLILFFSSFLQAYILPVALTWQAHTCEEEQTNMSGIIVKPQYCRHHISHIISYLSESPFPQHSVLSERVFSDRLPDKTQTQQNPLIDAYIVLIKTEILSGELNTILSLFPGQRVGPLVRNFTFQTRIQTRLR